MIIPAIHRLAALDNAALCAAMWRAHGHSVESFAGCVACSGTPPRLYPNVVSTDPEFEPQAQTRMIAERAERASGGFFVKDSYRALALENNGFEQLFQASWIHRPAHLSAAAVRLRWRRVTDPAVLRDWETAWGGGADEPTLFLPAFLAAEGVVVMAGRADGAIVAGCVVTETGAVAGVSNVFGDVQEVTGAVCAEFPDRDLVGYENGDALAAALDAGFRAIGDLAVWIRPDTISDNLP